MKRKQIELIVLIVGVVTIGFGLVMILTRDGDPSNMFLTNIIFAIGFLIYIAYSTLNTSSLQGDIRQLQAQIEGLKDSLNKREKELAQSKSEIDRLGVEKQEQAQKIADLEAQLAQGEDENPDAAGGA